MFAFRINTVKHIENNMAVNGCFTLLESTNYAFLLLFPHKLEIIYPFPLMYNLMT